MLLYLIIIAAGVGLFTFVREYLSNRRSIIADDVIDLLHLERQFEDFYKAEYDSESPEYTQEEYFTNAKDFHGTFKYHLSNKLHTFHGAGELSKKRSFLKKNPSAELDKVFPGFETEVRRVAHILIEELKTKLHNDALAKLEGRKRKRRRRR